MRHLVVPVSSSYIRRKLDEPPRSDEQRCRVVATSVGGVHEIAEGTSCRLVPAEDPAALSAAVAASLTEATQRGREGDGNTTKAGSLLTWQESSQQIVDVLARAGMIPRSP